MNDDTEGKMNEGEYQAIQNYVNKKRMFWLKCKCDVPNDHWKLPKVQSALKNALKVFKVQQNALKTSKAQRGDTSCWQPNWSTETGVNYCMAEAAEAILVALPDTNLGYLLECQAGVDADADAGNERTLRLENPAPVNLVSDNYTQFKRVDDGQEIFPVSVAFDEGSKGLSDCLSWHLKQEKYAQDILKDVCGGQYATQEEARRFLNGTLGKIFGLRDYQDLGLIPVRTQGDLVSGCYYLPGEPLYITTLHNNYDVDEDAEDDPGFFGCSVDRWSNRRGNNIDPERVQKQENVHLVEVVLPEGEKKRFIVWRSWQNYVYVAHREHLPQPYEIIDLGELGRHLYHPADVFRSCKNPPFQRGDDMCVEGYNGSVMATLIRMAVFLCERYPVTIWQMLEALLTGQFPLIPAITVVDDRFSLQNGGLSASAEGPATLTVQHWVTPEALAKKWREYRLFRQTKWDDPVPNPPPAYPPEWGSWVYPKQKVARKLNLPPTGVQADVLRFVLENTVPGEKFKWEKLTKLWMQRPAQTSEEEAEHPRMSGNITRGRIRNMFLRAGGTVLPDCEFYKPRRSRTKAKITFIPYVRK